MFHALIAALPIVAQTSPPTSPQPGGGVFNVQTLQSLGVLTAGTAALSPFFNALGTLIKAHPKIPSRALQFILPLCGIALGVAMVFLEVHFGNLRDPLTGFLIIALFLSASVTSMALYEAVKKADLLPSGGLEQISGTIPTNVSSSSSNPQGVSTWQAQEAPASTPNPLPSPPPPLTAPVSPPSPPTTGQAYNPFLPKAPMS